MPVMARDQSAYWLVYYDANKTQIGKPCVSGLKSSLGVQRRVINNSAARNNEAKGNSFNTHRSGHSVPNNARYAAVFLVPYKESYNSAHSSWSIPLFILDLSEHKLIEDVTNGSNSGA